MPRNTQHARSAIFWSAAVGIGFTAFTDNRRHRAQRLHVVDNRRAAVQSHDGGKRRLDARIAALALERFHQRRFFAAFIRASASVNQQIKINSRPKNIFSQITAGIGFRDGRIHSVQHVAVFAANVNEALVGVDGATRDNHAFNQLVRIHLHQRPVFAGARL